MFFEPVHEPLPFAEGPDPAAIAGLFAATWNTVGDGLAYNNRMWGYWKGKNGKWYLDTHHPNGATGPRSVVFQRAAAWKFLGTVGATASVLLSSGAIVQAIDDGRPQEAAKPGLDVGIVGWSAVTGPPGWVTGTGYFLIDATIGWGPALDSLNQNIEQNRAILGPTWVPWARE